MIVIVSDSEKENVGIGLYNYYRSINEEAEFISASNRNINPCYGCNRCKDKTYGKCVFRDDMDEILPILIQGDLVVYISPLLWGGFTYDIKKILDKTSLIGNRFYKVANHELVKGTISNNRKIVGVGVREGGFNNISKNEYSIFRNLLREIGTIMNIDYAGIVVDSTLTKRELKMTAREVLR